MGDYRVRLRLWSIVAAVRVLLVRLRLIGDVVFTTPIIGALRRAWPDAHLAYLIEPAAAPVVGHHPALNDVILAPRTRGWRRIRDDFRLGRRLRRDRYDLVLDLHSGPRASWLTWLSGAPRRVGFEVQGRQWAYTDVVPRSPRNPATSLGREPMGHPGTRAAGARGPLAHAGSGDDGARP